MRNSNKTSRLWKYKYPMFRVTSGELVILRKLLARAFLDKSCFLCNRLLHYYPSTLSTILTDRIQRALYPFSLLERSLGDCAQSDREVRYARYIWLVKLINHNTNQRQPADKRGSYAKTKKRNKKRS